MVLGINLLGRLRILKELKIKHHFSELQRKFNIDRHTDNDGKVVNKRRERKSIYHKFEEEITEKINIAVNNTVNQTTNILPIVLFKNEKEYLKPIPSRILLETYISM